MYLILSVAFLAIVSSAIYFFAFRKDNTQQTATNFEARVQRGDIAVTVTGTGTVLPIDEEAITPNVTANVKKLYIKNGDLVSNGDPIADLESDTLDLQIKKAQLELEKARFDLNDLADQKTQSTLTAPFAGRITSLEVKTGEEINKNTVLAVLQNDSQLVFDMPVSGEASSKIKTGNTVNVFLVDRGDYVSGKVISNNAQAITGYNGQARSNVKVAIPAQGNLAPGTVVFGTITIDGQEIDALATSKLEWLGDTEIKADIAGELTYLGVKKGQVVKEGEKLFTIKDDSGTTQQVSLQIAYEQAKLNLEDLQRQQKDLKVTANIDGVISGMDISEGDEISAGAKSSSEGTASSSSNSSVSTKTFGKIINSSQMSISFPVDEVDITKVKLGQKATVEVDALPGKTFEGKVTEIAEEGVVQNNVSSFDVTINIENKDKLLKSGMTANISITTQSKENVLLIPIEALQQSERISFVILAGQQGAQGQQRTQAQQNPGARQYQSARRQIEVGLTNESYAEVISGLEEGDRITLPALAGAENGSQGARGFSGGAMRMPGGGSFRGR